MKKSQLKKIIKEEISKVLNEDINQSKLGDIARLMKRSGIDVLDDEDNEEILKALNYPSDYSNEYKANMIIDYLGDHYSIEGSPEEFKKNLLIVLSKTKPEIVEPGTRIGTISREEGDTFYKLTKDLGPFRV
tara:strand:- start:74 stop:469 length:396 start_codon:yes stop_codon:yes gene_type:complete